MAAQNSAMIAPADGHAPEEMRRLIAIARLHWRNAGTTPSVNSPLQWPVEVRAAYLMVHDLIATRVEPCRANNWIGSRMLLADLSSDLQHMMQGKTRGGVEAHVLSVYIGAELAIMALTGYIVTAAH